MPARLFVIISIVFLLPLTIINLLIFAIPFVKLKPFVVISGSMQPLIPTGSIVYTSKKSVYGIGDVVTFQNNKETITHRIVKKIAVGRDIYFSTKGDMNRNVDIDLIHESFIYGKITSIMPNIGKVVMFYKNPVGLTISMTLPFIFLLYLIQVRKPSAAYRV